jgi:hypothetical protein
MRNGKKEMADTTDFDVIHEILADVWMDYRDDEAFAEIIEFADIGFPLAWAVHNGVVPSTDQSWDFVRNTWEMLLVLLKIEDTGFETLTDLFDTADLNNKKD